MLCLFITLTIVLFNLLNMNKRGSGIGTLLSLVNVLFEKKNYISSCIRGCNALGKLQASKSNKNQKRNIRREIYCSFILVILLYVQEFWAIRVKDQNGLVMFGWLISIKDVLVELYDKSTLNLLAGEFRIKHCMAITTYGRLHPRI